MPASTIPADLRPVDQSLRLLVLRRCAAAVGRGADDDQRQGARHVHRQAPSRTSSRRSAPACPPSSISPRGTRSCSATVAAPAFWDVAAFGLVRRPRQHLTFGEFSSKFATVTKTLRSSASPTHLERAGSRPDPRAEAGVDVYAWAHNETSTGVDGPVQRVAGADDDALRANRRHVRGRRAAGRRQPDRRYYFAPRSRSPRTAASGSPCSRPPPCAGRGDHGIRPWVPTSSTCPTAINNSAWTRPQRPRRRDPGDARQPGRVAQRPGRLDWATRRTKDSSGRLLRLGRGQRHATATSPTREPTQVVATIDFDDAIDASAIAKTLRANGVVDVEPYRKLGRNQLRVACFPAVEPDDVSKLIELRRARREPARLTPSPSPTCVGGRLDAAAADAGRTAVTCSASHADSGPGRGRTPRRPRKGLGRQRPSPERHTAGDSGRTARRP